MPQDLKVNQTGDYVSVSWTANNRAANYTVAAQQGTTAPVTCTTASDSCSFASLPCGTEFQITATASNGAGDSLPSFSVDLETGNRSKMTRV